MAASLVEVLLGYRRNGMGWDGMRGFCIAWSGILGKEWKESTLFESLVLCLDVPIHNVCLTNRRCIVVTEEY